MFRREKVRELEREVAYLEQHVEDYRDVVNRLRKEHAEHWATLTSPSGGYWLFASIMQGRGADTLVKVFASIPEAKRYIENVKPGKYDMYLPLTWAQIANMVDGRLVVLEELVAIPTRPWRRVWISVRG